jgi:hypothetical protein
MTSFLYVQNTKKDDQFIMFNNHIMRLHIYFSFLMLLIVKRAFICIYKHSYNVFKQIHALYYSI